ncbi:MAG TPA: aminotransferase class III-fold pyridoxal phosphate-dependent enzyme [Vitreimonas sp.]|nr:aminotransferase class III-fold pyridoxal phosphate-dependent enzyme [Vitreimonas sp.]
MPAPIVDGVLTSVPPSFTDAEAAQIAERLFGLVGHPSRARSERDQTFLFAGERPVVLKISNAAEDAARLDMEALAVQRVAAIDPELPVALPWLVPAGAGDPADPASYRATVDGPLGVHHVRMYDRLPGRASVPGSTLSDEAVRAWSAMAARLARALRGFWHPASRRVMLWDVQHALRLRDLLPVVPDAATRAIVARTLDRYEEVVTPVWPSLRAQVLHTDLCADNVLVDDDGTVTGIIDFGDMSFSALVVEAVSVVESMVAGRENHDIFRTIRIALDGFQRVTPLEVEELAIFGELLAARACTTLVVPAARASLHEEGDGLMAGLRVEARVLLEALDGAGWEAVARRLVDREPAVAVPVGKMRARREALLGPALTPLSYAEPLHLVRGEGVWVWDAEGRRYLDAYNNVPVVGHGHPRVTEAIARQARRLNTNLRYLHGTVLEVAERLIAATEASLDVVLFVNSGSEANDLAWRIACAATGGSGGICTSYAYHGISEAITALSPEGWSVGARRPEHVRTWDPRDPGPHGFAAAVADLVDAGHAPAAAILDSVLTSDGVFDLDPALARQLVRLAHDAGALWIADEVQGGHGRTGAMWSYQRLGITPDIVTLGKPIGNGHPVAAVITRRGLAERFAGTTDFFSTFGGNPVAMAASLAVLDVIDDEHIVDQARQTGDALRARLRALASQFPILRDVRGMGLATGVEVADAPAARGIADGLRHAGVLIGTTGADGNVLKIRPPLVFRPAHADVLVEALSSVLEAASDRQRAARP